MAPVIRRALLFLVGFALLVPASLWAQGRGNARPERPRVIVHDRDDDRDDRRGRDGRVVVQRDGGDDIVLRDGRRVIVLDQDDFRRYPVRSGRGPAFCRSGAGHPVFGVEWCLDKGFGIGHPGTWFLRGDDLFLRDRGRVIVLHDRARDADRAFWGTVVGQLLSWLE